MDRREILKPAEIVAAHRPSAMSLVRLAVMVVLAFALHALSWRIVPPDMRGFLLPWYRHILEAGPIGAFVQPFSNYTPPYLYLLAAGSLFDPLIAPFNLIKLLSVAGTAFLALGLGAMVKTLNPDRNKSTGALVFLLPSAVINAAYLGQCDAFWAGACLFAIAATIRGATVPALLWCGVAIAFKAQAGFIAPFIIGSLIGRRAPLWQWSIPGLVYCAAMLPAWMMGWPAADLALVYVRQASEFSFAGNLANPWLWVRSLDLLEGDARPFYWVGYAAALGASVAVIALAAGSVDRKRAMVCVALLSVIGIPWLLPKMHERYFFLADVLALALALGVRDRATWTIAIAVQVTSLMALFSYITDWPMPAMAGALMAALVLIETFREARRYGARWPTWPTASRNSGRLDVAAAGHDDRCILEPRHVT